MTNFLLLLPIASLVIVGIWNAFAPGMIFGWLADWLEKHVSEHFLKPVYSCPPCMASVHGTWVWFLAGGDLTWWPPFVLALSGLNRIVAGNILK